MLAAVKAVGASLKGEGRMAVVAATLTSPWAIETAAGGVVGGGEGGGRLAEGEGQGGGGGGEVDVAVVDRDRGCWGDRVDGEAAGAATAAGVAVGLGPAGAGHADLGRGDVDAGIGGERGRVVGGGVLLKVARRGAGGGVGGPGGERRGPAG